MPTFAEFLSRTTDPPGPGRPAGGTNHLANVARNGAIIDYILAHPAATQREIAAHFGFSMPHLSRLVSSDAFKGELAERRASLAAAVEKTTLERLQGLAHTAIKRMENEIQRDASLPHAEQRETCLMALKALGYCGTPQARESSQAVQINILSQEDLQNARARIGKRAELQATTESE